jgi:phage-related protein
MPGASRPRKLPARFYREESGDEPVRGWLLGLTREERRTIGTDILTVQYGWPLGMPLVRRLGGGLWEVRSGLGTRTARVILTFHEGEIVLLHGFIKKTPKTPPSDLELARRRARQVKA